MKLFFKFLISLACNDEIKLVLQNFFSCCKKFFSFPFCCPFFVLEPALYRVVMYFSKAISAKWISFILQQELDAYEREIKLKESINDDDDDDERLRRREKRWQQTDGEKKCCCLLARCKKKNKRITNLFTLKLFRFENIYRHCKVLEWYLTLTQTPFCCCLDIFI